MHSENVFTVVQEIQNFWVSWYYTKKVESIVLKFSEMNVISDMSDKEIFV